MCVYNCSLIDVYTIIPVFYTLSISQGKDCLNYSYCYTPSVVVGIPCICPLHSPTLCMCVGLLSLSLYPLTLPHSSCNHRVLYPARGSLPIRASREPASGCRLGALSELFCSAERSQRGRRRTECPNCLVELQPFICL